MEKLFGKLRWHFKFLSKDKHNDRRYPLNQRMKYAILRGDTERVRFLLSLGANPNAILGSFEERPIHAAIYSHADDKMLNYLLKAGADPNLEIYTDLNKRMNAYEFARKHDRSLVL